MRLLATIVAMLLLSTGAAYAHGSHGGGRHSSGGGSHYTHSHVTKKGEYVRGHYSTNPNKTKRDNWSTKGNTNPITGQPGTKPPKQ